MRLTTLLESVNTRTFMLMLQQKIVEDYDEEFKLKKMGEWTVGWCPRIADAYTTDMKVPTAFMMKDLTFVYLNMELLKDMSPEEALDTQYVSLPTSLSATVQTQDDANKWLDKELARWRFE